MRAEERAQQSESSISIMELICSPTLRAPLIIGIMMQLSQQLSGINAVSGTRFFLPAFVTFNWEIWLNGFRLSRFSTPAASGILLFHFTLHEFRTDGRERKVCNNRNWLHHGKYFVLCSRSFCYTTSPLLCELI